MSTSETRLFQNDTSRRLSWLQDNLGVTTSELARRADVERSYLSAMINHGKAVSLNAALAISTNLGIRLDWLLKGEGGPYLDGTAGASPFIPIKKFTVSASAGNGATNDTEPVHSFYAVNQEWIEERGLTADGLFVIDLTGDSMEPKLHDGDMIVGNRADITVADGRTYVVRLGDELLVKHVQRVSATEIDLISANTIYPSRRVNLQEEGDGIRIIGRVVASIQEW